MVVNFQDVHTFIIKVKDLAKENGIEVKSDSKDGVCLWPTYDKETGGLGNWFCLYFKTQEKQ
jgi:hypothetical protein